MERQRARAHLSDYQWLCQNHPRPLKPLQKVRAPKRIRKQQLLAEQRKKIIELRFGEYRENYADLNPVRIKYSLAEIARMLGLKATTVRTLVQRYVTIGCIKAFNRTLPAW